VLRCLQFLQLRLHYILIDCLVLGQDFADLSRVKAEQRVLREVELAGYLLLVAVRILELTAGLRLGIRDVTVARLEIIQESIVDMLDIIGKLFLSILHHRMVPAEVL